jgi:nitroreductase
MAKIINDRETTYPVNDLFLKRWSPRAFSSEPITHEEMMTLFEAARWATSEYNNQPWRFIYARRDTPEWEKLFSLLVSFNQAWVKNTALLVCVVSHNLIEYNDQPSRTHSFDAGSAWMSLALQAHIMGLAAHGMSGIDYDRAKKALQVPDDYTVEMMFAVGRPGDKANLPQELAAKEAPSQRKPLASLLCEGVFTL